MSTYYPFLHFYEVGKDDLKGLIQLLALCTNNWGQEGDMSALLNQFQNKYLSAGFIDNFAHLANINVHYDVKAVVMKVLESTKADTFIFGNANKTKCCVVCDEFNVATVPRKSFSLNIDVNKGDTIQRCVDNSLHRCRICLDCSCSESVKAYNQYETVRYTHYPEILTIFLNYANDDAHFQIDKTITMPDLRNYTLLGFFATNGERIQVVGQSNEVFYEICKKIRLGSFEDMISNYSREISTYSDLQIRVMFYSRCG